MLLVLSILLSISYKIAKPNTLHCTSNLLIYNTSRTTNIFINILMPRITDLQRSRVPLLLGRLDHSARNNFTENKQNLTPFKEYIDFYFGLDKKYDIQLDLQEVFFIKKKLTRPIPIFETYLQYNIKTETFSHLHNEEYKEKRTNKDMVAENVFYKIKIEVFNDKGRVIYNIEQCNELYVKPFYIVISNKEKIKRGILYMYNNDKISNELIQCQAYRIPIEYECNNVCRFLNKKVFENTKTNIFNMETLKLNKKVYVVLVIIITTGLICLGILLYIFLYKYYRKEKSPDGNISLDALKLV